MTIEEAIHYLTPIAESASLPNYKAALTLAIEALKADRWISVKDRLPEEIGYPPVICGHTTDIWTDAAVVNGGRQFIGSDGCEIFPTHWMPLPEPPKEDT